MNYPAVPRKIIEERKKNYEESILYITPHLLRFLSSNLLNNKQLKTQEMKENA